MKTKRILSLFIAIVFCLSYFTVFAETDEQVVTISEETLEEVVVPSEEPSDDPAEEIVAMPEEDDDGKIDYGDLSNWAYWDEGSKNPADLFIVCPTVDMGEAGNYIADIEGEKYRRYFIGALCQELGIYNEVSSIYAPYYRQATFPVYSLSEEEREVYLEFAYNDIKDAFLYYAENADDTRPLILAGFSQGADLVIRLIKDLFDEPKYQRRLVAAYAIGWKLTEDEVAEFPHVMPAKEETDTGVIIAFNSEAEDVTSSIIVAENEKTYSINPLNWKTTSEMADKSLNKGACFTDYSGNIKQEIPNLTGAYIDEKRGTLKLPDIVKEDYSSSMFDDGVYHLYDYQFFFRNLQENVKARLSAYIEKYSDRLNVFYNNEIMAFDVEPVIENSRTLVPFRAIFEIMGCAVYYAEEEGKQIVSARRGNDNLTITIGETKMYFNGKEIPLDVPAKIKDGRTLVPLRAISEAFECEVFWYGEDRTIYIDPPVNAYVVFSEKLSETITDDDGNVLIEAVAYYPVIKNRGNIPCLDKINFDYKWDAEKFIEEAKAKKEDALNLQKEMGESFTPFVYELTYEQTYRNWGYLSFINHKYVNVGGVHPAKTMESRTYCTSFEEEMSVSMVIDEDVLDVSLVEYVTALFVEKFKEISPEAADTYNYDYVKENLGYVQFYITNNSLVLYFNQGEVAPYALGVISVEIPYDAELFGVDMRFNCLDEYVCEYEHYQDYEWQLYLYSEEKVVIAEETTEYAPEDIYSEYYPVGVNKFTIKGIDKGNASVILLYKKKGEGVESSTKICFLSFYIDENNKITLVSEDILE